MYCENCGKSLIRGYQFCLECGTPVPPEHQGEEEQAVMQPTEANEPQGMPAIEPISSEEGGMLVFCQTCGMRMQKTTTHCEKCGMALQGGSNNIPKNGDVPLWNTNADNSFEGMSDGDIDQINNFMSGGGISAPEGYDDSASSFDQFGGGGIGGSAAEIDALTAQFANLCKSTNEMPAIGSQDQIINDEVRKVENFAMDSSYVDNMYIEQGNLPVIEGTSMDFDPNEPEPEDPNAFVMTPEPIEEITPNYVAPVAEEIPTYEEPVAEEIAPAAEEIPTYEEPVAEEIAPVAEEIPAYEEPVAEEIAPAAEEIPAYEEPVAEEIAPVAEEIPAYEEPVAEEIAPVAEEIPTYEEPVAEEIAPTAEADDIDTFIPVYKDEESSNADDIPVYSEPEYPSYSADIPVYSEPEAEPVPAAEVPTYSEPAPTYESTSENIAAAASAVATDDAFTSSVSVESAAESEDDHAAIPAPMPVSAAPAAEMQPEATEPEVDLGRLLYCRNCGQDMYEKELVCKNCGAPKREEYKPKNHKDKKPPFKLFGIFSIPSLVVAAVVVIGIGILVLTSVTAQKKDIVDNSSHITGNEQLNANNTTTQATTPEPIESEPDTTDPAVTTPDATTASEPVTTTDNDTSVPEESTKPGEDNQTSKPEESDTSRPEQSSAPSTTTPKPNTTTTPKPVATTTPKPATTPSNAGSSYTPSATIKEQNKERNAIIGAMQTVAEEVGKVDALARSAIYAMMFDARDVEVAGKSFYNHELAKAMLNQIKSGKSAVTYAVSNARPTNTELKNAYNLLCTLEDRYVAYYNYVVNATAFSNYESKCDNYLNGFITAAANCKISTLNTSAQSTTDKNQYYADVLSDALTAVDNAASAYNTLRTKISALNESTFASKYNNVLTSNVSTYLKAAGYTQTAVMYSKILASAPSAYSSAYSSLKTAADSLVSAGDTVHLAQYDNTLAGFKSSLNSDVTAATNASASAKRYL